MISTRPEKSVGNDQIWEDATKALVGALDELGWKYGTDEGGGAFYGPKIDRQDVAVLENPMRIRLRVLPPT